MSEKKEKLPVEKSVLHPRNKHRNRYDFKVLTTSCPELAKYVKANPKGEDTIDFSNPKAVKFLNQALLKQYYGVNYWDIPNGYLCPPIPGRADYLHYIADLMGSSNKGRIPKGASIKCMDIGVGASCIYPIIGTKEYGWKFIGTDIELPALESSEKIIKNNPALAQHVELRHQKNPYDIFHSVMDRKEPIDITICNPPFHKSAEEAQKGTLRKLSSLTKKKATVPVRNFGGQSNELWCEGGEERFVRNMIRQSKQFASNCFWFTTIISKQSHLEPIYDALQKAGATQVKTLPMGQGTKISRIVVWTFLTPAQQEKWIATKWNTL